VPHPWVGLSWSREPSLS